MPLGEEALAPEMLIEVQPKYPSGGTIVWEWRAWDHMIQDFDATKDNYGVISNNPGKIDINYERNLSKLEVDIHHVSGLDNNPTLYQIILSVHKFDEIWIIDHSTTTAQAATYSGGNSGRGGEILYRWGNPRTYGHGSRADRKIKVVHHPQWIPSDFTGAGNLLC